MTEPEQMHRCERGARCEAVETVEINGQTADVGAPCDRPLCGLCENHVHAALHAAPRLYGRLREAALERSTTAQGQRVTSSRPGSFGLNGGPLFLAENLHWQVTAWADEVIATAGRPTVDRASQPERDQVADACALLARYLTVWAVHAPAEFQVTRDNADPDDPKALPTEDTVAVVQSGWEACAWLIDWRASAERLLHIPLLVHYPPEPCPQCDQPGTLRREDGDGKVRCVACRKAWTLEMYETFVHAWLGGEPAPPPERRPGPSTSAEGQDARTGAAAHLREDAA